MITKKQDDLSLAFETAKYKRDKPHLKIINNRKDSPLKRVVGSNERITQERRNILLKELRNETRNSEFNDEREKFIVNKDLQNREFPNIATKLLVRKSKLSNRNKKKADFNLDEDDEYDYSNESFSSNLDFTHEGKSLSLIDDSTISRYNNDSSDNDEDLDKKVMPDFFFGQGNTEEFNENQIKSRKEIFKEIIEKSKLAKMEMKRSRVNLEEELLNLNDAFTEVQSLLKFKQSKKEKINSLLSNDISKVFGTNEKFKNEPDDYEVIRSELKFDMRSGVSDRIKTKEEIAKLNSEKLEKLEKERKERMLMDISTGFESNDDEVLSNSSEKNELTGNDESNTDISEEEVLDDDISDINSNSKSDENSSNFSEEIELNRNYFEISQFHLDHLESIEWLKNDENEQELPFSINLKKILTEYTLDELIRFLGKFSPISQWKFIHRFRACFDKGDTSMLNDLKLLFGFLIKYPLKYVKEVQQNNNKTVIFDFVIKYLKLMSDHLLFMVETDIKECLIIFSYFTLEICHTTFPSVMKAKKIEKFVNSLLDVENENYYTEILEECPSLFESSSDIYELTLEHIIMCRMMFLVFPITDAQHPILTPVIICLEQWAYRWTQVGKSFLYTSQNNKNSEYNQIRLITNPNIKCIIGVINLLEMASIGYGNISQSENFLRFSTGYFTLSLSCLKWLIITKNSEHNFLLAAGILKSLLRVIEAFKSVEGFHAIVLHLLLPTIKQIELSDFLDKNSKIEIKNIDSLNYLVTQINELCLEISNRSLKPINLCPRQTPTIRTLTPKLDDPSVPFAAKEMLRSKSSSKESQYEFEKKLYISKMKKEVNKVRRQANRQLRKDAQIIAGIWHENKTAKSKKQMSKYNSFMKMLEDDQVEYKKMKTTGGTMDTSIQSYRANKQLKKKNKRMAGNRTANGIIQ